MSLQSLLSDRGCNPGHTSGKTLVMLSVWHICRSWLLWFWLGVPVGLGGAVPRSWMIGVYGQGEPRNISICSMPPPI